MLDKSSKPAMSWKLTSKASCIFSFRIILSLLAREVVLWCPQVGLNRFPWSDHLNIMPLCFEFQASSWAWHWNGRINSLWGFEIGFIKAYTRWVDFRTIWKYWVFSLFQVSHRPLYSLIVTCPGLIFIFFHSSIRSSLSTITLFFFFLMRHTMNGAVQLWCRIQFRSSHDRLVRDNNRWGYKIPTAVYERPRWATTASSNIKRKNKGTNLSPPQPHPRARHRIMAAVPSGNYLSFNFQIWSLSTSDPLAGRELPIFLDFKEEDGLGKSIFVVVSKRGWCGWWWFNGK